MLSNTFINWFEGLRVFLGRGTGQTNHSRAEWAWTLLGSVWLGGVWDWRGCRPISLIWPFSATRSQPPISRRWDCSWAYWPGRLWDQHSLALALPMLWQSSHSSGGQGLEALGWAHYFCFQSMASCEKAGLRLLRAFRGGLQVGSKLL